MRKISIVIIAVAVGSMVLGIISRIMKTPVMFGIESKALYLFASSCLLLAIALILLEKK